MNLFFKSRRFRQGSLATGITVAVLALVILCNLLLGALAEKYPLKLDMTSNRAFALSQTSLDFVGGLQTDITIYVLATEEEFTNQGDASDYFVQAAEVIKKYAQASGRIRVSFVDYLLDPTFVQRFPDLQLSFGSILVQSGEGAAQRYKTVSVYDLFNVEQSYYGNVIASSKAEQAMTSAILAVTSDQKTVVSVLSGYGEAAPDPLVALLEANNYQISKQNILTEDIPAEASIAVILAPERDWHEDDIAKLDRFLQNEGKTVLYFSHFTQPDNLPNLSAFLADWGIKVNSGAIMETSNRRYIYGSPANPLAQYTEEFFSQTARSRDMPFVMPQAKPLEALFENRGSIYTGIILQFSETAVVYPLDAPEGWKPQDAAITGPLPAAIVASNASQPSHVVVFASFTALDSALLDHTSYGNADFVLDLCDILSGRQDVVRIEAKTMGGEPLGLNEAQFGVLGLLTIVVFPLAIMIIGALVWLSRRHL